MSNSVTILRDVIQFYYARRQIGGIRMQEMPAINIWVPELFYYKYSRYTITLLQRLLESKRSQSERKRYNYIITWNLLQRGEHFLLHQLLRYDLVDVESLEEFPEIKFEGSEQHDNIPVVNSGTIDFRWHELYGLQKFLYKMEHCTCVSQRRLRVVLWGLDAIATYGDPCDLTLNKVLSIKTVFEFLREPYITSSEIVDVIKEMKIGDTSPSRLQKWRDIHEDYFPESRLAYQPRSLQHLCRFRIRQNLREVGKFPDEVEALHLPRSLAIVPKVLEADSADVSAYFESKDITFGFRLSFESDYVFNMMMMLLFPQRNTNMN